jgi:pimeloyl-ACP methyl ester carboxylesterase
VIACGTADVHVGPNEAYAASARDAGDDVELVLFEGAGHFELVDAQAPEWRTLRSKLEEMLA